MERVRAGNFDVYGFLEPQSIQRSGQSQFESKSYIKSWIQSSKQDVYLGAYLNGRHWQMVVILPKENLVVWFCSLHNRSDNYLRRIINRLQDSTTSAEQAFKLLLGKEKFGRVGCFGRIVTPSHLKRKEEIFALKEHANEWNNWARRFEGLESLLICFMKQNNPNLDDEALDDMIRNVVANENSNAAM
ncbi:hypothetical protein HKD37_15G043921 [Glycine soja]